MLVLGLGPGG